MCIVLIITFALFLVPEPSANSHHHYHNQLQYIDEDPDECIPLNPQSRPFKSTRSLSGSACSFHTTMDDRESIYLDTISITSNATLANHRRSLALSRQTIYHSAEDVNTEEQHPDYGYDLPDHPPGNGILKNTNRSRDEGPVSSEEVEHYARKLGNLEGRPTDEVTALLTNLDEHSGPVPSSPSAGHLSNKTKKETITYSQWKARVNTEYESSSHLSILAACFLSLCPTISQPRYNN